MKTNEHIISEKKFLRKSGSKTHSKLCFLTKKITY